MEYGIERDGTPTARGTTNLAAYDYRIRKPCRLPAQFREVVQGFVGLGE